MIRGGIVFLLLFFLMADGSAQVSRVFNVQSGENVRRYAKWMGTSSLRIRSIVGLGRSQDLAVGRVVSIPMTDRVWARFRQRRKKFLLTYRPPKKTSKVRRPQTETQPVRARVRRPDRVKKKPAPAKKEPAPKVLKPIAPRPVAPPVKRLNPSPSGKVRSRPQEVSIFHGPSGSWIEHEVRSGEFLIRIAQHYGVVPQTIRDANGKGSLKRIIPRQILLIPMTASEWPDGRHVVAPGSGSQRSLDKAYVGTSLRLVRGETISQVALLAEISPQSLMALNGIENANRVRSGKRIWVPMLRARAERFKNLRNWWLKKHKKSKGR